MNVIVETERLILREFNGGDAESIYLLNEDPDVVRFTGDLPFADINAAEKFLQSYDQYSKYGFGRWAVILKENQDFLGWCGLRYTPEKNEYDLGFRFYKKFWNKGFATEAGRASLQVGFQKFSMNRILGRAMHANLASIQVLQKCGMTYLREQECGAHAGVIYKIDKDQ